MAGADVFCAPSLYGESFGIVLLEAMASQTAVVASDLAGYSRVTGNGQYGALFPAGDVVALRARLGELLERRSLRDDLVARGSERVIEFSMQRLADLYLEAYERLLV